MILFLRYGAVARGPNAYVPPGARKGLPSAVAPAAPAPIAALPASASTSVKDPDVPKVSINAPDGSTVHSDTTTPAPSPSPAPSASQKVLHLIWSNYGAIEEHYVMTTVSTASSGCTSCVPRICYSREAEADAKAQGTGEEREG